MLIIFSCWTVWWNITMTLSSSPPRGVGADIDAAISSLITSLSTFLSAQENAISYYDSKADSDYVSTVRTAPSSPACLPYTPNPTHSSSHPFPATPPHSPAFLGVDRPSLPSPSLQPPSGHRPLGCLCVLVRWHCFMVSWCDKQGQADVHVTVTSAVLPQCDIQRPPPDPKCVHYRLQRCTHHRTLSYTRKLFLSIILFIPKNMNDI